MRKTVVSFIFGFVFASVIFIYWFVLRTHTYEEIYSVQHIESHFPHEHENSETTLIVYLEGDHGHVKELLCLFPPSLVLEGGPNPSLADKVLGLAEKPNWTGISKVLVKGMAKEYLGGTVAYYCEKIE